MNWDTEQVVHEVQASCADATGHKTIETITFGYREVDPYAVTLTFAGPVAVVWTFARDLLQRGLAAPIGDGDVHIWPFLDQADNALVIIELSSPDGQLAVRANASDVRLFLAQTIELVPPGAETALLDVDGLVAQLLQAR